MERGQRVTEREQVHAVLPRGLEGQVGHKERRGGSVHRRQRNMDGMKVQQVEVIKVKVLGG